MSAARPHEAGETYQRCRAVLRAEQRMEPSAATQELYRSLYPLKNVSSL
jgi:hypothetical protein